MCCAGPNVPRFNDFEFWDGILADHGSSILNGECSLEIVLKPKIDFPKILGVKPPKRKSGLLLAYHLRETATLGQSPPEFFQEFPIWKGGCCRF